MAYVPGTEIEKPTVDFTGLKGGPAQKIQICKTALRRAGVPENIITTFTTAARGWFSAGFDGVIADYVVIAP